MTKQIFGTAILVFIYSILLCWINHSHGFNMAVLIAFSIIIANQIMNKSDGE